MYRHLDPLMGPPSSVLQAIRNATTGIRLDSCPRQHDLRSTLDIFHRKHFGMLHVTFLTVQETFPEDQGELSQGDRITVTIFSAFLDDSPHVCNETTAARMMLAAAGACSVGPGAAGPAGPTLLPLWQPPPRTSRSPVVVAAAGRDLGTATTALAISGYAPPELLAQGGGGCAQRAASGYRMAATQCCGRPRGLLRHRQRCRCAVRAAIRSAGRAAAVEVTRGAKQFRVLRFSSTARLLSSFIFPQRHDFLLK